MVDKNSSVAKPLLQLVFAAAMALIVILTGSVIFSDNYGVIFIPQWP